MMEVLIVIRCGSAPVPTVLGGRRRIQVSEVPTKDEVNRALAEVGPGRRLVLCGTDAALAAVLTRLLRTENRAHPRHPRVRATDRIGGGQARHPRHVA